MLRFTKNVIIIAVVSAMILLTVQGNDEQFENVIFF